MLSYTHLQQMWMYRFIRSPTFVCYNCKRPYHWFTCRKTIKSPDSDRFLKNTGSVSPDTSIDTKVVDSRLRTIRSLEALRNLCDKTKPSGALNISQLSVVGQLYVLRILNSSGVLYQRSDNCILEEFKFAQEAIWQLLTSVECLLNTGDVTTFRSKHVVGLLWHLVKLANNLSKGIDLNVVDYQAVKQAASRSAASFITSAYERSDLVNVRFLLLLRLLNLVTGFLRRLQESAINLNGKDIQQILMLACEDLFLSMPSTSSDSSEGRECASDSEADLVEAKRDALRCIEELVRSYIYILNDSEITSVYVSFFNKPVSQSIMTLLSRGIAERSDKGYLNITMPQCITLFNISKTQHVPKNAIKVLLSQLESCQFRRIRDGEPKSEEPQYHSSILDIPTAASPIRCDAVDWLYSFCNVTMMDIGRLCKSLYHLKCSDKLLDNFDQRLISLLKSAYLRTRLRIRHLSEDSLLNGNLVTIAAIVHLFAKNGYNQCQSKGGVVDIMSTIPWDINNTDELALLGDMCWSLLTLKVKAGLLKDHLECFISRLSDLPMKHSVKLLGGLYNSVGNSFVREDPEPRYSTGRETMDDMLAYTLQCVSFPSISEDDTATSFKNRYDFGGDYEARRYMQRLRHYFMDRVQDVDDVQCISNFMFYISSTLDNLNETEFSILCSRWLDLSYESSPRIKVESLTQVLWSLQKNRIYHEACLIRIRQLLSEQMAWCSLGQLALVSHTLSSFNLQDGNFVRSLLNRAESLATEKDRLCDESVTRNGKDMWDVKLVSVIWSVIITDFTLLPISLIRDLLNLLRHVDWQHFTTNSKYQDQRKILQIHTSLSVELPTKAHYIDGYPPYSLIPNSVLLAAAKGSNTITNSSILSVSQDKARRSLSSFGINYKGEYEVHSGIVVDFAISLNGASEEFEPDLIIEIDGPHHYNVVCDGCSLPYQQVGPLRLLPSGKTLYRNRMLKKLGFKLEIINWIDAHRRPIHHTLAEILRRHRYSVAVKQK